MDDHTEWSISMWSLGREAHENELVTSTVTNADILNGHNSTRTNLSEDLMKQRLSIGRPNGTSPDTNISQTGLDGTSISNVVPDTKVNETALRKSTIGVMSTGLSGTTPHGSINKNPSKNTIGLPTEGPNGTPSDYIIGTSTAGINGQGPSTSANGIQNKIIDTTAPRAKVNQTAPGATINGAPNEDMNQTPSAVIDGKVPRVAPSVPNVPEPLAIIGMAFQFPSGAVTESAFWDMLISQKCASSEFPADRMNIDAFYNADTKKPSAIHTRSAHFLDHDIRRFDAHHFNIPPLEAGAMDPDQRGLMETTYHALENAGIPTSSLTGSNTSVHVGFFSSDHMTFNLRDPLRIPKYYATGSGTSILSNRISWHFNLRGPSMTIDTACSSGLVAMDLACKGLWAGTSDIAIVGAANLILSPELNIALCNMNFLSPNGKCYSFDHRASGYARGEGFSAIILKPLSKALAAGDSIRALVRSIGSNQDGHTSGGITQPSREMQAQLIRETYAKAGLDMRETRFFEAHGTGTLVGDPTEARAIGESFRKHRTDDEPLYVGAVKSNIGHLEGASGLAGVVKAVLALEKGIIPPNTNFEALNPGIDDEFFRLRFPQKPTPWPQGDVRRASVNSFGFGGSNAHVVLDDAFSYLQSKKLQGNHFSVPVQPKNSVAVDRDAIKVNAANGHAINRHATSEHTTNEHTTNEHTTNGYATNGGANGNESCHHPQGEYLSEKDAEMTPKLIILSSSAEAGMVNQIDVHSTHLQNSDPSSLPDYAYTLATRRSLLLWRSFGVVHSLDQLGSLPSLMSKPVKSLGSDLKLGFVFTGQGAQWHGMGIELLSEPVFWDSIHKSQNCLEEIGCPWLLVERLTSKMYASSIDEAQFSQIITTCVQLALFDLIAWMGIQPSVVVGHSSGEIAAAYAAGHISRASAIRVSYYRGHLGSKLEETCTTRYCMAAVGLSRNDATSEIEMLETQRDSAVELGSLTVSCINSPLNVTISGPDSQIDILIEHMAKKRVFARKLKVGLGYHSPQMLHISDEYLSLLGYLEPGHCVLKTRPAMVSSVTGSIIDGSLVCTGKYWVRNMISPVDFLSALRFCHMLATLGESNSRIDGSHMRELRTDGWLEIGPHAALKGPIRETLKSLPHESEVVYTSALIRNKSAISSILVAAGELFCRSFPVDMTRTASLGLSSRQRKSLKVLPNLPKYQFDHSALHWEETQLNKNFRFRKHGNHDLLGAMISEPNALESQWKFIIKEDDMPWVRDHKVDGSVLYPAAGMIVMAIEAAKQLLDDNMPAAFEFEDVEFPAPIVITSAPDGVEVRIHMSSNSNGAKREIYYKFRIFLYRADGSHEVVCTGKLRGSYSPATPIFIEGKEDDEKAVRVKSDFEATVAACKQLLGHDEMYQMIRTDTGLDYGPTFQVLDHVHCDGFGKAVATVLPQELGSTTPYTVHPSRLDGVFQLGFAAVVAMNKAKTMVPTLVSRLWIPLGGFGHPNQTSEKAFVDVRDISDRSATFDIKAVCGSDAQLIVEISGLEVTSVVSSAEAATTLTNAPYICSHMEWKVDVDTLQQKEMQGYCEAARTSKPDPMEYFGHMDILVFQYGARALTEVDRKGKLVTPSMAKYTTWLRSQVDASPGTPLLGNDELERVCASVRHTVRGELHIIIGQHLVEFLCGEADPLQVIFADEAKVTEFYRELMEDTTGVDPFNRYLDAFVHKNPALRFVEVGAGTGASTSVIMGTIGNPDIGPRFEEYMYTDISPSFFEQARRKFSEHTRMKYQVLNVEQDIERQDFKLGAYDVVIADNVLHVTTDLRVTLNNIRKLLRPGGKLILKELVTPKRMLTGFLFGLLPGWWLFSDAERDMSPLLSVEMWHEILKETGFSGIDLSFQDHLSVEAHLWSMMVSTAEASVSTPETKLVISPHLILNPTSVLQKVIAIDLARTLGLPDEPTFLTLATASALCSTDPNVHSFIFLNEIDQSVLREIQEHDFFLIQKFLEGARGIIWVKQGGGVSCTSSPDYGISDGLCRVSRREHNNVVVSVSLENADISSVNNIAKAFKLTHDVIQLGSTNYESEYMEIEGRLCVNRLQRARMIDEHLFKRTTQPVLQQQIGDSKLQLGIRARGLLDTIQFSEDASFDKPLSATEVDVEVRAIGVNYKDCLTLLGKTNSDFFGSECSGIVKAIGKDVKHLAVGDRVLAGALDVFRTFVRVPKRAVIRIPDTMEFPEAASIFTAYCTAYYSLVTVARLQKGESVLIHAAAGGTGQAMIQVAQHVGAEVYATVGSSSKKDLLTNVYGIAGTHIFYSRDASFADGIKRMTGRRGVDVVINSQQGRLLEASWDCIAIFGRFIDIGLKDAFLRGQLPMHVFTRNVSFSGINLDMLVKHDKSLSLKIMKDVLDLFVKGKLKAVTPLHCYPLQETEQALRFLQSGKSSGKIILEVHKAASVPVVQGRESRYYFRKDGTYIIAGGLGGIGRSIACWLVQRGAKNLILVSRSGGDKRAQDVVAELRSDGVNVQCPVCDIADFLSLKNALEECAKTMPPIRGCIQAAMVLRDSTFSKLSLDEWRQATRPKIQGSWNLHEALPNGMDFFILLSSVAGIVGNLGQSSYCSGNTYQDAFARYRASIGEKALTIDVGVVLDEGFVAENRDVMDRLMRLDLFRPNPLAEIFAILDYYCNPNLQAVKPLHSQVVTGIELPADIETKGRDIPSALEQPIFRYMQQAEGSYKRMQDSNSQVRTFQAAFNSADSASAGALVVAEALKKKLSRVLGLPEEHINIESALDSYGVDSLVGLELRNWLFKESGADLAVFEILGGATISQIGNIVATKSTMRPRGWALGNER